ncbi:uncharacterized protein LOC105648226 isoform X2 [Jatropha curcas]|nr:uncharacterized protein LOC105648226 isoform X2 [Jatropha curcas]
MVKVSGCVDSSILIKKLIKSGKKAEVWSPVSKYKLNEEQANINPKQFLANDSNASKNHYMFPKSFINEIEDKGSFEKFPSQNIKMKAVDNHDPVVAKRMGNNYMYDDIFIGDSRLEDDMAPLIDHGDYQENGTGFLRLGRQEFQGMPSYNHNHPPVPPQIMANRKQGHHYSYPSMQNNFIHMQDGHANNNMIKDFDMHQSHAISDAFSMSPNTGSNFHAVPHSYY